MSPTEHTVQYELRAQDNWELSKYVFRANPRYWLMHAALVFGTAGLAASIRGLEDQTGAFDLGMFAGVALFMGVFDYGVQRLKSAHRAKRTAGLIGPHELRITPEGVYGTTDGVESHVTWSRIASVVETEAWLYLFLNRVSAVIVPIGAFENAAHRERFVTAADAWRAAGSSGNR